ncbi:endonuclease/exonuclease/phosphatase family protein [Fulvimarina sp. MAC8]|uniref:endonuclease/exonuclease/phosphatase family protein n=1 Tax=Fulvimarina sp. MAC8 TaxID=3162874 RepID=UPI0032EB714B
MAAMYLTKVRIAPAILFFLLVCALIPLFLTAPFYGYGASNDTVRSADRPTASLLQMNLRYDAEAAPAVKLIRSVGADIVTLQEAKERWVDALSAVEDIYPYRVLCGVEKPLGGNVILSKFQIIENDTACIDRLGLVATRIELAENQSLTVASQHLVWPWPYQQWPQIKALSPILSELQAPLIIGGDFNAAPWSAALDVYADATNTHPVKRIGASFAPYALPVSWKSFIGLPIDNIFVSDEIEILSTGTIEPTASDHLPVLTRFALRQ